MKRSSRWGSTLACAALLAVAAPTFAVDLDVFLPKDTDVVVSVNVRQALDSPLVKKYALDLVKTALMGNKQAQDMIKAFGLDPLTDFKRVSVGMSLADVVNQKAFILVEGKFDVKKISDAMDALAKNEPKEYSLETVGGKTVYKIAASGQEPMYAAPLDSNVLVLASTKAAVGASFEAINGTRKAVIKKELADLLAKADAKSSLYLVASTKGKADAFPLPDPAMKKVVEQIHSLAIDIKVENDISLEVTIGTADADEAKKMRDLIVTGLDIAKVQAKVFAATQPQLQPLIDLANSLTAKQFEQSVVIKGKVTGEALEKAFKKN